MTFPPYLDPLHGDYVLGDVEYDISTPPQYPSVDTPMVVGYTRGGNRLHATTWVDGDQADSVCGHVVVESEGAFTVNMLGWPDFCAMCRGQLPDAIEMWFQWLDDNDLAQHYFGKQTR